MIEQRIKQKRQGKMWAIVSFCLFGLFHYAAFSQDDRGYDAITSGIRVDAQALSAAEMQGRGYQENGHQLAASYIASRFAEMGVQPVFDPNADGNGYLQPFRATLNLVNDEPALILNAEPLEIGEDFIVHSRSGRAELEGLKVVDLGYGLPEAFGKSYENKVVLFRSGLPEKIEKDPALKKKYAAVAGDEVKLDYATKMKAKAVIIVKKKLTASLSMMPMDIPVVEVLESAMPSKKVKKCSLKVSTRLTGLGLSNVIGWVQGSQYPDSFVIVSAHYDHLGRQGSAIFYGANDNASGTAAMLSMAGYFAQPAHRPKCSMLFIAFGGEEAGLLGSRHYVESSPAKPLAQTKFILNLDLMGNGDEGIMAVAGLDFPDDFARLQALNTELNAVTQVKGRGNAPNSDHYFFVKNGVKGMFIFTMGGPPHYHDVHDTYAELRFPKAAELQGLLVKFLEYEMGQL